jgi:hypothetical protein
MKREEKTPHQFTASIFFSCWGRQPGRGRAACTCSRRARHEPRWCSHGKRGQPRRLDSGIEVSLSETKTYKDSVFAPSKGGGIRTVVALLSLGAVTGHVAESTARVAGLGALAVATTVAAATVTTALGAVTSNVSDLAALVALLATRGTTEATGGTALAALGALTGKVAGHAAAVAGTLLGGLGAVTV